MPVIEEYYEPQNEEFSKQCLVMSNKNDQSHPTPIKRLRSEILSSRSPLQVLGTLKHTLVGKYSCAHHKLSENDHLVSTWLRI